MASNSTAFRSFRAVSDKTLPQFVGPKVRVAPRPANGNDIALGINYRAVTMAPKPAHYNDASTEDLIEIANMHLQATGFKGLVVNSRASAHAALLGIRIGGPVCA